MTVLVTGGTGTVGSAVAAALSRRGTAVRVAARRPPAQPLPERAEFLALDLASPDGFGPALEGVTSVFFLSPLEAGMVERAGRFVERARAEGVRQLVRLSALGAGWAAPTRLGRVHREVERIVEDAGMRWTCLRPNGFMQNFVTQCGASIREHGVFSMPQGDGAVSVVDVLDVAAVAVAALAGDALDSCALDLTGPSAIDNHEAAEILSRVLSRPIRYVDEPASRTRAQLASFGLDPWLVEVIMELFEISADGRAAYVTTDVERSIGRPATRFEAFAARVGAALSR